MTAWRSTAATGIICIEDNDAVARALQTALTKAGFQWVAWLQTAEALPSLLPPAGQTLVVLDYDLPGSNALTAVGAAHAHPGVRVVLFSAHLRRSIIERTLDAGAWGVASKGDGHSELIDVLHRVCRDEVAFSPDAARIFDGG